MRTINSRDEELLKCCYEHNFLLFEHVADGFFEGKTYQSGWNRIRDLRGLGLISCESNAALGQRKVLRLTKQGEKYVQHLDPMPVRQKEALSLATFEHDVLLLSVRQRLMKLWDGKWIPEGALKKQDFIEVPDGIVVFSSGKRIAIEVERTPKGKTRFMGLLDRWRKIDVLMVLYVVDSPKMFSILKSYLREGPTDVAFGLVLWNDLKAGTPVVWTPGEPIDLFSVRTL
ncbi:MAG TPA: hypothetical protein DCS07_04360 [Bdellovibrionales bacterium]|nr:MAG: hypothetical protein A2X97_02190 [Bdellovibrionales bacterium GWA1_52_35]OFZ33615.1 MAG: hypothetical protein A2070_03280 [Bdellovibrionales bacterium GWC1_52_8]HAR41852.1 hypothetical protein [Bdellovibrionales bacterium]HCM39249.1 hypothetical protein [Bdellovibrionales bacterium]